MKKIAELLHTSAPEDELRRAVVNAVNRRFYGKDVPDNIIKVRAHVASSQAPRPPVVPAFWNGGSREQEPGLGTPAGVWSGECVSSFDGGAPWELVVREAVPPRPPPHASREEITRARVGGITPSLELEIELAPGEASCLGLCRCRPTCRHSPQRMHLSV